MKTKESSIREVVRLAILLCDHVKAHHDNQGKLHLNIMPANIKVTSEAVSLCSTHRFVKEINGEIKILQSSLMVSFLPPEVVLRSRGKNAHIGEHSDNYQIIKVMMTLLQPQEEFVSANDVMKNPTVKASSEQARTQLLAILKNSLNSTKTRAEKYPTTEALKLELKKLYSMLK